MEGKHLDLSFLPPNFCKRLPLAKPKQTPIRREPRDALSRATSLEAVLGAEHRGVGVPTSRLVSAPSSVMSAHRTRLGPPRWDSVRRLEGVGGRERPAGTRPFHKTA